MSFKEWLYSELISDGIIDDSYDEDDLTFDMLIQETELDEEGFSEYKTQFEEHCESIQQIPNWDVE